MRKRFEMKTGETPEENLPINYSTIKSPVGDLMLVGDASDLIGLYFFACDHIPAASNQWSLKPKHPVLQQAAAQLDEYFAGKRTRFSIPLRLTGTDFQEKVWQEIALIPYGQTISYSELAERAGAPQAVRAAGTTTGRNPVSIIVPCHRVMGKNGSMTGFAGGLEKKRYLLELENSIPKPEKLLPGFPLCLPGRLGQ